MSTFAIWYYTEVLIKNYSIKTDWNNRKNYDWIFYGSGLKITIFKNDQGFFTILFLIRSQDRLFTSSCQQKLKKISSDDSMNLSRGATFHAAAPNPNAARSASSSE